MIHASHQAGIEAALKHGGDTHSIHDVEALVAGQYAQLWQTERACIVTEVDQAPGAKTLRFWLATGDLEEVIVMSRGIEDWGRRQGCTRSEFAGRRGWERVLAAEGWSPSLIVLTKEL